MAKIFYLQGDYPFCYYYRGYLPGVYSDQTVVTEFFRKDSDVSNIDFTSRALEADIICFQRPTTQAAYDLARLLKQRGKKIVFDNDDSYSGVPLARLGSERQVEIAKELNTNLNKFVEMADGITTSTEILGEEYRKLNPNTIVLKNCIDPLDEFDCKKNTTGKFRVGLIGSVTSNDDYFHIKDQIKKLDEQGDITFVILGVKFGDGKIMPSMQEDYDFWSSLKNVEWHPVVHCTEYMAKVASFALDLAIIPRKEHYFNQCKSNLKALEMSLLKIPVLAQGFSDGTSPYQNSDLTEFINIVEDNSTWYNLINEIKEKHSHYLSLAEKAHNLVLKEYNINNYAQVWDEQIIKLVYEDTK